MKYFRGFDTGRLIYLGYEKDMILMEVWWLSATKEARNTELRSIVLKLVVARERKLVEKTLVTQ